MTISIPNTFATAVSTIPLSQLDANFAAVATGGAASGTNADITQLNNLSGGFGGGQLAGLRNRIINGDMRIDQRNNGASILPSILFGGTVDRFLYQIGAASKLLFQQIVDAPPGFKYCLKVYVSTQYAPAAADVFRIYQGIEGQNLVDLQLGLATATPITVSFWVKGSVAGTYSVSLSNAANNSNYVATFPVTASWVKQTVTLTGQTSGTWATDNTGGIYLTFDLGSGTNSNTTAGAWQSGSYTRTSGCVTFVNQTAGASFYITGVQLELGTVATPFENRPIGMELALCQRYYETGSSYIRNDYRSDNAAGFGSSSQFAVVKRISPNMGIGSTTGSAGTTAQAITALSASSFYASATGVVSVGGVSAQIFQCSWTASAEL